MRMKPNSTNKFFCLLFFAVYCIFASCKEPSGLPDDNSDNGYKNPNAGTSRELTFSHNSGLYAQQFSLTLTAASGNAIYYSTDGSIPLPGKVGNGYVFKYSSPIAIKNRNGQANVLAANAEKFYGYENDPRGSMPVIYQPGNAQVPKATVIRAIAVDSQGNQSDVLTKTYFIGDNLAAYGNVRVVSLVSDPYNLTDENYGIMVRGNPNNRWDSDPPYNFRRKGAAWEREAYLDLFEWNGNGRSVPASTSTGVGIRVRGGWSRASGQKSFSVYFKEQYGINNLKNYTLIPGAVKADGKTPVATYKGFMLRNGANDGDQTKFYDVFLQNLLSDRGFSTQAAVPCVLYLNGEYWGPYNFQERYSDNHTEYKYGVKKENVISFDNGELDDGNPGEDSLFWSMMNMGNNDMSQPANYAAFCDVFDIQNFIDYWAGQIYIYNEDWPQNNYRLWRTRTVEPGNPYGDTKWRWQMFDTEFAIGIYNSGALTSSGKDAFDRILNGDNKDSHNNKLFAALLANNDFCRQFVNTMMDIYNVNFHPDFCLAKLDNYAAIYRPLMAGYSARWNPYWVSFEEKVNDARRYLTDIRPAMTNTYLPKYFGGKLGFNSGSLSNVTLAATASGASIKINTITPALTGGSWMGQYYRGVPVTVTASTPQSGYEFDGWTVTGGNAVTPSALTTTVNLTGSYVTITAKYKSAGSMAVPVTGISLNKSNISSMKIGAAETLSAAVTPSNATYKTVFWSSGNDLIVTVDNIGKVTAKGAGTAVITAAALEGGYTAACAVTVIGRNVLLDLAQVLQNKGTQTIDTGEKFNAAFSGVPISTDGIGDGGVKYRIINEGGAKKLEVTNYSLWAPGLRIEGITFQAGDTIEIKGTFKSVDPRVNWFVLNKDTTGWSALQDWGCGYGDFERSFTLTQSDVNTIYNNIIRISTGGIDPWNGLSPTPISTFNLEQVKVSGYRD